MEFQKLLSDVHNAFNAVWEAYGPGVHVLAYRAGWDPELPPVLTHVRATWVEVMDALLEPPDNTGGGPSRT
ncbi:MAG: hypothetical protein GEU99_05070 [Luteitalea sp.]|nr:hypothetical protein [Luteitalea sp.]